MDHRDAQGGRRIAWGGAVLLGAAAAIGLPSLPDTLTSRLPWGHEAPRVVLATPPRGVQVPLRDAPPPLPEAPRRSLRVAALLTDLDDARAGVADPGGLWVATGGGLLRLPDDGAAEGWTVADGLPDHRLTAIALCAGGLALGTEGGGVVLLDLPTADAPVHLRGLAGVDGIRVTDLLCRPDRLFVATAERGVWSVDPVDASDLRPVGPATGLATRRITALGWSRGHLLAGTAGAGLWVFPPAGPPSRRVARGGLAGDFVTDIASGDDAWVASVGGVTRVRGDALFASDAPTGLVQALAGPRLFGLAGGDVVSGAVRATLDGEGRPPQIRFVAHDAGRAWVGTDQGVAMAVADGWRWRRQGGPGSNDLTSVAAEHGRVVVGSFDRGAARWDGTWTRLPIGPVDGVAWHAGDPWLATARGLVRWSPAGAHRFDAAHGLAGHATALRVDGGGLWVGTGVGVQRFDGGLMPAAPIPLVHDLWVDDGTVWAGTQHGLAELRGGEVRWHGYEDGALPDSWVTSLTRATDGALWVGTYDHGLARLDADGWRWFDGLPAERAWINPRALAALPDGTVVAGTLGTGLIRLDRSGVVERWTTADGLAGDDVTGVAIDGAVLWVATRAGLTRMEVLDVPQS